MCVTKTRLNLCAPVSHWEQKLKKIPERLPAEISGRYGSQQKSFRVAFIFSQKQEEQGGASGGRKRPEQKLFHLYQLKNVNQKLLC
jgi:hypothetical protein